MVAHPGVFSKYTKYLTNAPWFRCQLCGFSYNIPPDIIERIAGDRALMFYTKRLVKKSIVMHICSHLIGGTIIFPDPALDDEPVGLGEEFYLVARIKWFRELDIPTLYSIREDARDRARLTVTRECQIRIPGYHEVLHAEYNRVIQLCGRCIDKLMLKNGLCIDPFPTFAKMKWVCSPGNIIPDCIPEVRPLPSKTYLKPWKDPESLFCDTKFLTQLLGKEPRKGDECRDGEEK